MKKTARYLTIFIIASVLLLIALSINNMFWVSTSPEWETTYTVHNLIGHWTGPVKEYSSIELIGYLVGYRIFTVWSNFRDLGSAVLVGLLVMISVMLRDKIKGLS